MKYPFHIVDVYSSTPFGGNQLAVLPDATGISTEGMQKIAREFNFGETTFVLPKNDPANTCRVRIFTPRVELDFAGHPSVGTACALVMKQHVRLSDPIRLILEENVGPVKDWKPLKWQGYYSLRCGIATQLNTITRDPMAAKGLLRHSSVNTTLTHYIKPVPEVAANGMAQVEQLFSAAAGQAVQ
jgi:predicted PhzF superfamily epimerase YddE/YHI9